MEAASEQDELRIVTDARDVANHITEMAEHAETDWFARPVSLTRDDDTVGANTDYFQLCFSLSPRLIWGRAGTGPHQAPTRSIDGQVPASTWSRTHE